MMSLYYPPNYRTAEQLAQMHQLEAEGVCLFCPEHLPNFRPVLHRTEHWSVVANQFPYRGTRLHFLMLPDEHVEDIVDLSPASQVDFWTALRWIRDEQGLEYYGLAARNGDCAFTGGTIRHVHLHVLQGDVSDPEHVGVRVKLSSHPGEVHPDQLHAGRP
jgi:ATP adenylyltransferase